AYPPSLQAPPAPPALSTQALSSQALGWGQGNQGNEGNPVTAVATNTPQGHFQ
ncbi:unnamed protein product, partial [Laminaria digitata]